VQPSWLQSASGSSARWRVGLDALPAKGGAGAFFRRAGRVGRCRRTESLYGHLEKLLLILIDCGLGVNVNESERERTGIICGQFCGVG
jgi:hypothetical protein